MMTQKMKYITDISKIPQLSPEEIKELKKVTERFPFRANTYYLSLINWEDKSDPIRRMIIPDPAEGRDEKWGSIDPSDEASYTVASGLEHKYKDTALFLISGLCGGQCRYCFRKRLFMKERKNEILRDIRPALRYIKTHPEIDNLLLTGGDPLRLPTKSLRKVLSGLRAIDHLQIIRVGTKMPVYNPYRVIDDPELPKVLKEFSTPEKRIYFMLHFSHPSEITREAIKAVSILRDSGVILCNQNPMLRGINDNPEVLTRLFNKLSFIGVCPYYVFQCRPTLGNKPYAVPVVRGYQIFEEAKKTVSGLAKRAKFVMSHSSGKIEVVGLDEDFIYMKYQRAPDPEDNGKFIKAKRNDQAYWFDDFEVISEFSFKIKKEG